MSGTKPKKEKIFTRYQAFIIAILATLQFTIILDFMILSPLGAKLLNELHITTSQFGNVVSAYAFSAGISGILAAGFADKFDRKKMLLFFYTGFVLGTLLCGIAPNYEFLLMARIVTGIFGGVISSITFAISTDLFAMEVRGRVMGFIQTAFAASQVMGLPIGLYLANHFDWHAPFLMIVGLCIVVGIAIVVYMKPIDAHLKTRIDRNPFHHLVKTIIETRYARTFAATALLATGGFMMLPFAAAFSVNNLGVTDAQLPMVYLFVGIFSIFAGPLVGMLSDKIGKYKVFTFGSIWTAIIAVIYCNYGLTPIWLVILTNIIMFVGVTSRMISASALTTAIPAPQDRGAFMSINSAVQQFSGGIAAIVAGLIVVKTPSGKLENYDILGYVVAGAILITIALMYNINKMVKEKAVTTKPVVSVENVESV